MALPFVRVEFVKRSEGKNTCAKAAYNSKTRIAFEGNKFKDKEIYDWSSNTEKPIFHDVLLPSHVNTKYKNIEYLWNVVEKFEKRKDSQVGRDVVLALPDDEVISPDDKYELAKIFAYKHFVSQGFGVQIDVHPPKMHSFFSEETGKLETKEHNWHAHLLVTVREFEESGETFSKKKQREKVPTVRRGKVVTAINYVKEWIDLQNEFFEERGLDLRVDPTGIVPTIHLGPYRMRHKLAVELLEKNEILIGKNENFSKDPAKILKKLTETQSTFSKKDVEKYISKFIKYSELENVRESFWKNSDVVQLYDKKTQQPLQEFSSKDVVREEDKIMRMSERLHEMKAISLNFDKNDAPSTLTEEQKQAYTKITRGRGLSLVEGHAGTGKSALLYELKELYEKEGYVVRAFGPDSATVQVLEEKGFKNAVNIPYFLFKNYYKKTPRKISLYREVWVVDEAGKVGNEHLAEFLRLAVKNEAQVILTGGTEQLPSVQRGGMFKLLCNQFGCELLKDIKRQQFDYQREISKKLALREMSSAFDMIASNGIFHWTNTKEEAVIKIVEKWAVDRIYYPCSTSVIIAHTNAEVRHINNLARLCRKELGELGEKEFLCKMIYGNGLVSEGDIIEFRKNDRKLNVYNGSKGVLISAKHNEFIVQIRENGIEKQIKFDPNEYSSFQLGYATTLNRSQGKSLKRVYVLHHRRMNRPMFYVGLTRHIRSIDYFISQKDASCLAELKLQALREIEKLSTLNFTTYDKIREEQEKQQTQQRIENLKGSDSIVENAKGFGLAAWNAIYSKVKKSATDFKDNFKNHELYNFKSPKESSITEVIEVENDLKPLLKEKLKEVVEAKNSKQTPDFSFDDLQSKNIHKRSPEIDNSQKDMLKAYSEKVNIASELREIVKIESEKTGKNEKAVLHYSEWQKECEERNKLANELVKGLSPKILKNLFNKKSYDILIDRSTRYEELCRPKENIEDQLKENIEPLLHALFPEGPSRKDSKGFRFGSKGSLSVTCLGPKSGLFHDFETKEGGGMLALIRKCKGLDVKDSKKWAKEFLGTAPKFSTTRIFSTKNIESKREDEWVSQKIDKQAHVPGLGEVSKYLNKSYNLVSLYPYIDSKGDVLFYNLRLEAKDNPTEKIFTPLSYGYWKHDPNHSLWNLKKYNAGNGKNPVYNAFQLEKNATMPVLIVEGEKTAEAASKLLGEFVTISWFGGAGNVNSTDWTQTYGREIVIWPDNDQAGYKASESLTSILREAGAKSIKVVDKTILEKELPKKWDLADPLPKGKNQQFITDMLLRAKDKAVNLDQFIMSFKDTKISSIEKFQAQEILRQVENRLRPDLEIHNPKTWEINDQVIKEAHKICSAKQEIEKKLLENGTSGDLCKRLAYHVMLFQAKSGEAPTQDTIEGIKQTIVNSLKYQNDIVFVKETGVSKEIIDFAFDKILGGTFSKAKTYKLDFLEKLDSSFKNDILNYARVISKSIESDQTSQQLISKQIKSSKEIEK